MDSKSLLQHHSLKASILWCSAFFMVQLSHPYMTPGKTIALTRWTFVGRVTSLLFNVLSRFVIGFLPGLIFFKIDSFAVQGTLKNLLQHHSSKPSILQCSTFFLVQLLHLYMTPGKTIALTTWTFVGKVMSLLLNMPSTLVITFLPRSKRLLISWLQSPSAVILEPKK